MTEDSQNMQASLSVLIMSIASSALIFMGMAPHEDGTVKADKNLARFNIDLLVVLKDKTKGNTTTEETQFLENLIADLQKKFVS